MEFLSQITSNYIDFIIISKHKRIQYEDSNLGHQGPFIANTNIDKGTYYQKSTYVPTISHYVHGYART